MVELNGVSVKMVYGQYHELTLTAEEHLKDLEQKLFSNIVVAKIRGIADPLFSSTHLFQMLVETYFVSFIRRT